MKTSRAAYSWSVRLARAVVNFYPRAWRLRYQDEVNELLCETGADLSGVLDLLRGAWDAHLHVGELLAWDTSSRVRRATVASLAAWAAFIVAVCGLLKVGDDPAFALLGREHPALGWAGWAILATTVASALLVAVGALPLVLAATSQAWRGRDRRLSALLCFPVIAAMVFVLLGWGLGRLQLPAAEMWLGRALFLLWIVLGVVLVVLCVIVVRSVVARCDISLRLWAWASHVAVAASATMMIGGVAVLGYAVELAVIDPDLFRGPGGLAATPLPFTLVPVVMVAVAAAVAGLRFAEGGYGILRGRRAAN